ncbi:MAG: Ig-like domain-containing protein [Pseudomonadota bacterium]
MKLNNHLTRVKLSLRRLGFILAIILAGNAPALASIADHHEFEATLHVPFRADADTRTGNESRYFTMEFDYPLVQREQAVTWRLELLTADGKLVQKWVGIEKLFKQPVSVKVLWAGRRFGAKSLPDGMYQVRLSASANEAMALSRTGSSTELTVENSLSRGAFDVTVQSWPMQVGAVAAPSMPAFTALPQAQAQRAKAQTSAVSGAAKPGAKTQAMVAASTLPYTIYFGNLHSQTNHSDGGGNLSSCTGAQAPQSAAFGPADAYQYAMNRGLDFLMTSEHNHMYDGSDSTNAAAIPATARNLYQSGLTAANTFNAAHPNFLGIYGMEWGVINNGGHMNIFNSNELLEWEYNSSNQLIGDTFTAKGDYSALYTLMRQRGWIGQFNHPAASGQFSAGGVALGYTADGDQAMVLCEVLNTSAFSTNTTETETGRSNYEAACNKALEAGYHLAFSTDQDNHCANWGASYTNRTGVLIPNGTAMNSTSFIDALKARRVFATMDKNSQLVLTANGHVMGERFANSGPLTLISNFASSTGRTAATVEIYEGVPGRNGTVSLLSSTASTTITPANGEHFYYAKITQDDGKILWSAPIWISQSTGSSDTTAPVVSGTESGTSGTITLSANASDNVGVIRVDFYVDNVLKGSKTSAPYSITLNSTTLSNASHAYVAKAYDATNNVGSSTAVNFTINNPVADTTAPTVSVTAPGSSGTITLSASASDNVGVSLVEFYVDGVLKGSTNLAPYSLSLNSTTLSNASHTLSAKAYDAANNVGTSNTVNFTVNNSVASQLILNSGFESGAASWTATSGVITNDAGEAAHAGTYKAWLNGYGAAHTDSLYQQITIPSTATSATLSFWLKVDSDETTTTQAYDTLQVQVRNSSGTVLATLASYSNLNKGSTFLNKSFDLSSYKGQSIRIYFLGVEGSVTATSFIVDDVSVVVQ